MPSFNEDRSYDVEKLASPASNAATDAHDTGIAGMAFPPGYRNPHPTIGFVDDVTSHRYPLKGDSRPAQHEHEPLGTHHHPPAPMRQNSTDSRSS